MNTTTKPIAAACEDIERQRTEIFRAMAMIDVVHESLPRDEEFNRRSVLMSAYDTLNGAAGALETPTLFENEPVARTDDESSPPAPRGAPKPAPEFNFNHEAQAALEQVWKIKDRVATAADGISSSSVGAPDSVHRLTKALMLLELSAQTLEAVLTDPAEDRRWKEWGDIYDNPARPELFRKSPY